MQSNSVTRQVTFNRTKIGRKCLKLEIFKIRHFEHFSNTVLLTSFTIILYFLVFFRALDRNEYNHITATYFLLAERKLRMQRSDQHAKTIQAGGLCNPAKATLEAKASLKSEAGAADKAEKTKKSGPSWASELEAFKEVSSSDEASRETSSPPLPPIPMASSMPPPT